MLVIANKEKFRELVKRLRKDVRDSDKGDMYIINDIIKNYRQDIYFNKEFFLLMNVFQFSDGFKVEVTNDELDALSVILFHEIDLMQTNNEVEIKKESKKNIWHFNPDLAEYLPNGEIKRLQTMINHFNEEGLKIFEKTHETLDIIPALRDKCSYKNEYNEYVYMFDNGTEFTLIEDELHTIATVIVDEY